MNKEQNQIATAKRWVRILAFIIDYIVISSFIISVLFFLVGINFIDIDRIETIPPKVLIIVMMGIFLYLAKDDFKGRSIGKYILNIGVRDVDNVALIPPKRRTFLRNVFLIVWPIELIVFLMNRRKMRLGDKAAKTVVVADSKNPMKVKKLLLLLGFTFVILTLTLFFAATTIKKTNAYNVAIEGIENNKEILSQTGGIEGYGRFPTGNLTISKSKGDLELNIRVMGSQKNIPVKIYLHKEPNQLWQVMKIEN